jgi:alpha-N-arabinofuranosidase
VHEGIYREEISPPRGGTSDDKRIVYQAAPGETVEIRGSEVVKGWTQQADGIWRIELPNTLFADFNPFADEVTGDWFDPKGRKHHTGCVYQDGEWLFEAASKDELPTLRKKSWFAVVDEKTTTIWATFDGDNPNDSVTEVNVRQTVFYPRRPFVNYITVRGFKMRHAAPRWAPPTAEQMGLIGTHWSKGWIIENNEISHSINVGLSLGKYGDEFDNIGPTAQAYLDAIDRASAEMGWNKETIGSHIVRNNVIAWCEQAGIVGSMGAVFSMIKSNYVHHIYTQRRFTGAEMGGIKIHAPIDVLIEGNRIHDAFGGIWLDWMAQGTRVTGNLCYRNLDYDLFLEVNHGPFLVDNNIFLSRLAKHHSQGGAYVHNLFGGVVGAVTDARHTPYFKAHSTEKVADHVINVGDDRFYNNMFNGRRGSHIDKGWWEGMKTHPTWRFGYGLWIYDTRAQGPRTAGNIYYDGAKPYTGEDAVVVKTSPKIKVQVIGHEVYLHITVDPKQSHAKTRMVTSDLLGKAQVPDLPFENTDGKPFTIDTDYFGKKRDTKNPFCGPFEQPGNGRVKLKVWPK